MGKLSPVTLGLVVWISILTNNTLKVQADDGQVLLDAAKKGDIYIVKVLIRTGIEVNWKDGDGNTPLYVASCNSQIDIIMALLLGGANPDVKINTGATPLHAATEAGNINVIQALLAGGANPNIPSNTGATPLHAATESGKINVIQALLAAGANPNIPSRTGATPLHAATEAGNINVIQALLASGADVSIANENGENPLHQAIQGNRLQIAQQLLITIEHTCPHTTEEHVVPEPEAEPSAVPELIAEHIALPEPEPIAVPGIGCPESGGFFKLAGSQQCYRAFVDKERTWEDASTVCKSEDLALAEPKNPLQVRTFLNELFGERHYWLGAKWSGSSWQWERDDQRLLSNTSPLWYPGHPGSYKTGKCLMMTAYGGSMAAHPGQPLYSLGCTRTFYPLCEVIME